MRGEVRRGSRGKKTVRPIYSEVLIMRAEIFEEGQTEVFILNT